MGNHIAIIDDSPTVRNILDGILSREGFLVTSYTSGVEALNVLAQSHPDCLPDLIFLNIEMPQMDGYDVTKWLRKCPKLGHIIIVMISSRDHVTDRIKAYLVGAQAYLTKPLATSDLLQVIAEHVKSA